MAEAGELEELKRRAQAAERIGREQRQLAKMLADIAHQVNIASSFDEAIEYTLQRICKPSRWSISHLLVADEDDPDELSLIGWYYAVDDERLDLCRQMTEHARHSRHQGLAAKVLGGTDMEWSTDVPTDLGERFVETCRQLGIKTVAAFPIHVGQAVVGVLELFAEETIEPRERLAAVLRTVAAYLGRAFEREDLLRRIRYVAAIEQERIAQELHDAVSQELAALALSADAISRRLKRCQSDEADNVAEHARQIRGTMETVRRVARGLPTIPAGPGELASRLATLAEQFDQLPGPSCASDCDTAIDIRDSDVATHLYRIAQEAVHNAIRHARATHIRIRLRQRSGEIALEIVDDGIGLSTTNRGSGHGLRIMAKRSRLIGARLSIGAGPEGGTMVACLRPLDVRRQASVLG